MRRSSKDRGTLLPTVTHARIRAEQGDAAGARRILGEILLDRPDHAVARALLDEVASFRARHPALEPDPDPLEPPVPGDPATLSARFQESGRPGAAQGATVVRLNEWLERIRNARNRGRAR